MRGGGERLETLFLGLSSAPLIRRRETIKSRPFLQATWRGVSPSYREKDETRRGGIGDVILGIKLSSTLQEKRNNGILCWRSGPWTVAIVASPMERSVATLRKGG
jgi:hypothetical protein